MLRTLRIFLNFVALAAAIGELRDDLGLDTTPIFEGPPMTKLTTEESDQLGKTCGANIQRNSIFKIHNGDAAKIGQFPSTVYIDTIFPSFGFIHKHCTGTLISENHVLTAAHCVENERDWIYPGFIYVHMGGVCVNQQEECANSDYYKNSSFSKSITVKSYMRFKEYAGLPRADIVVLELRSPAAVSARAHPACLVGAHAEYSEEQDLYTNGFGKDENQNSANHLRYFKTKFGNPSYDSSDEKRDCLNVKHQNCGLSCKRETDSGDSGSGLLTVVGGRLSVLGPAHGTGPELTCYTDIRYYVDVICKNVGICYNQDNGNKVKYSYF